MQFEFTDPRILENYRDLALAITMQECKEYYRRRCVLKTHRGSNRVWYENGVKRMRQHLITNSWGSMMGVDMESVVNELDRRANNSEPMSWGRFVNTANNKFTKGSV